jgi:hypothetical protein
MAGKFTVKSNWQMMARLFERARPGQRKKGRKTMPYIGLGLHFIVALFFAIHAMKNGRNLTWLFVLFSFPLLGSIVYFVVEFWPDMRSTRAARAAGKALRDIADPKRELRDARHAFDLAPSVAARMRLANAYLNTGDADQAREHLTAALTGSHASDPDILTKLAEANMQLGDADGTASALRQLFEHHPERNTGDAALLFARALGGAGDAHAEAAFQQALKSASGPEARLRYGQWLASRSEFARAKEQFAEITQDAKHWTPHARSLNKQWLADAQRALVEIAQR